jgi:hypothetical protein
VIHRYHISPGIDPHTHELNEEDLVAELSALFQTALDAGQPLTLMMTSQAAQSRVKVAS